MQTDYDKQAQDFLDRHGVRFIVKPARPFHPTRWMESIDKVMGMQPDATDCPPNAEKSPTRSPHNCPHCGSVHGRKFLITLSRGTRRVEFPFWASMADCWEVVFPGKIAQYWKAKEYTPTPYDVLATISSEATIPDTFEDWCAEFGCATDSRRAYATWESCRDMALKLVRFFSPAELEELAEIR